MNSNRIIYTSYQPYTLELAKQLRKELGWEPVFWHVDDISVKPVLAEFPNVITHKYQHAVKGKLPAGFNENDLEPLDENILNALRDAETVALNMMNRNYLDAPFEYQDRLRLFHRHIRFYLTLLKRLTPDYIVFEDTPHEANDYVLYMIAGYLGIKTIMFESSMFYDYFFAMEKFEAGNLKLRKTYLEMCNQLPLAPVILSEYGRNEINKVRGTFDGGMQDYMVTHLANFKKTGDGPFLNRLMNYFFTFIKLFNIRKFKKRLKAVLALTEPTFLNFYKKRNTTIENSVLSNLDYILALRKLKKIKAGNLEYYRSIQNNNPDLNVPFIFCALHFQPEKSTSPWGGHFVNQYLVIHMLSKAVPAGWKIYVKDHISQYAYPHTGESFRNKAFFDDIALLQNVEFLPMEFISFELIDKARAVASVAGSVLWESAARNKPTLAFGIGHHAWCGGCEGVFYTPDMDSLKAAIKKIIEGYKVDPNKFELYAHLTEELGYKGYVGGRAQALRSGITPEENGILHVKAIKELLQINAS